MADFYQNIPELSAEQARIARRRKIAEMMQQQAMEPIKQQTAGGYVVPTHPLEAIAKVMQGYMGRSADKESDVAHTDLGTKAAGMQSTERQKIVEALTPKAETQFMPDMMPEEQNPFGGLIATEARNQTPQAQLGSLIQAGGDAQFPANQKWADTQQKYLEKKINDESLQQAHTDAAKQKQLDRLAQIEAARAGKADADPKAQRPFLVTDNAGNSKIVDVRGNIVKDLGAVGKPTGAFEKAGIAKKKLGTDLDTAIKELEKATKDDGLIDQSTGSGAGALVDMGAGFFGKGTKGAIAVGELKPIYDLVLKMVPRFEGPQSDRDTASYEKAAGQLANPAVPNDIKKAAGREILRLMKQRKSQFFDKTSDISGASDASSSSAMSEADKILGL